jgi:hypothetical protein
MSRSWPPVSSKPIPNATAGTMPCKMPGINQFLNMLLCRAAIGAGKRDSNLHGHTAAFPLEFENLQRQFRQHGKYDFFVLDFFLPVFHLRVQ